MYLFRRPLVAGLFFCCLFAAAPTLHAQKILGADISYTYLGSDSMEVTLIAYLRCDGKSSNFAPGDILVKPKSSSSFTSALSYVNDTDITPVAPGQCTPCNGDTSCTFKYGVLRQEYSAKFSLKSFSDCEFTFSWQGYGREINGKGIYVDAWYERCIAGPHSSPAIIVPPVSVICKKSPVIHSFFSPTWHNKDSISYKLTSSRTTVDTLYKYPSGYYYDNPLNYDGYPDPEGEFDPPKAKGFHLDTETGEIKFQPMIEESAVLTVKITHWRKDSTGTHKTIGTTVRDVQYDVVDCGITRSPVVTGVDCMKTTSFTYCAGSKKCFKICSFDPDSTDSVRISIYNPISNSSFVADTGKWPKSQFCWTPTNADVRSYPYRMVVEGADISGAISNKTHKTFAFYVKPAPEGLIKQTLDKCGWVTLEALLTNSNQAGSIKSYTWNGPQGPQGAFANIRGHKIKVKYSPDPTKTITKYPITLTIETAAGCETHITDTVIINPYAYADLGPDTNVCAGTKVKLKAKQYFGKPDYLYSWLVYNTATKGYDLKADKVKGLDTFDITANEDKIVIVRVLDGEPCDNTDTIRIFANQSRNPFLGPDRKGCKGVPVILDAGKDANGDTLSGIKTWEWYKKDSSGGWLSLDTGQTLAVTDSGTYRVLVTDSVGCTGIDEVEVFFFPMVDVVKAGFTVCRGDTARLAAGIGTSSTNWEWYDVDSPSSPPVALTRTYHFLPSATGPKMEWKFRVRAIDKHTADKIDCADEDTITLRLDTTCTRPCTSKLLSGDTTICRGDTISLHASGGTGYHWFPSAGVSDTTSASPQVYTAVNTTYFVRITDSVKKCVDTFSVTITVDSNCVWPGDANYDKIADYKDVLTIGVGYGRTGSARDSISTAWQPLPSKEWTRNLASGVNYKHIDCNGDSAIDLDDVKAVAANYGKKHKKSGEPQQAGANDPTITIRFAEDTFYAGDTVRAELMAGSITNPLADAYGIGLELEAGAPFIVPGSLSFDFSCNTFCDTAGSIPFVKTISSGVEGALVRTDHFGTNGTHKIADIEFVLRDSTYNYSNSGDILSLELNELILIDTAGNELPANQDIQTVNVFRSREEPAGIQSVDRELGEIRIYPNPASTILTIETGSVSVDEIVMLNTLGHTVYSHRGQIGNSIKIPVSRFSSGIYFFHIRTTLGTASRKIIIAR